MLPGLCSIATLMFFNYIQHVHADAGSENDHSRNFTSKTFNFSFQQRLSHGPSRETRPALERVASRTTQMAHAINPRLNEGSLAWFLAPAITLLPLIPRLGTRQLGPDPGLVRCACRALLDEWFQQRRAQPMIREGVAAGVSGPAMAPPSS